MKKLTSLWLALLFLLAPLTGCAQDTGVTGSADGPTEVIVSDSESLSGAGTDGSITDGPTSAQRQNSARLSPGLKPSRSAIPCLRKRAATPAATRLRST